MNRRFVSLFVAILLLSCQHAFGPNDTSTESIPQNYGHITEPHARWQAYGLKNYIIEQKRVCFCAFPHGFVRLTIKDNKIVQGLDLANGQKVPESILQYYQTIDQLFAWIDTMQAKKPEHFEIEYDARFGYPKKIAFDYSAGVADDELWIEMQSLAKLPGNTTSSVVITDTPPDSLQVDSFSLNAMAINGDTLTVDLTHGGGCKEHFYALFMSPAYFIKTLPAQAELYLQHNANGDLCEALLRPKLRFNLRPVAELYKKLYQRQDPIRINVYQFFQGQPGEKLSVLYQPQ